MKKEFFLHNLASLKLSFTYYCATPTWMNKPREKLPHEEFKERGLMSPFY